MLAPIFALITPYILWPIEQVLPYPYVVEELAKAVLVLIILKSKENTIYQGILVGFAFSLSETVFYFFNITDIQTLLTRFLTTTPLHIVTTLIILLPAMKKKYLLLPGLLIAIVIHYIYNQNVVLL